MTVNKATSVNIAFQQAESIIMLQLPAPRMIAHRNAQPEFRVQCSRL